MLKADPDFGNAYLAAALKDAELPGGQSALQTALRLITDAQALPMGTSLMNQLRQVARY